LSRILQRFIACIFVLNRKLLSFPIQLSGNIRIDEIAGKILNFSKNDNPTKTKNFSPYFFANHFF
jgi:hypothetical protein